jgi:hypothetical protein
MRQTAVDEIMRKGKNSMLISSRPSPETIQPMVEGIQHMRQGLAWAGGAKRTSRIPWERTCRAIAMAADEAIARKWVS